MIPHADSQLKQIDGMIQYFLRSLRGHDVDSKSTNSSQVDG